MFQDYDQAVLDADPHIPQCDTMGCKHHAGYACKDCGSLSCRSHAAPGEDRFMRCGRCWGKSQRKRSRGSRPLRRVAQIAS